MIILFQSVLSKFTAGDYSNISLSEDTHNEFNIWYKQHVLNTNNGQPENNNNHHEQETRESLVENGIAGNSMGNSNGLPPGVITVQPEETRRPHYLAGRPRVRTAFDPEHEIPRLNKWFDENQHPTREQMHEYLEELNLLPFRQSSKALDIANVTHWFKNARAAKRRAAMNNCKVTGDNSGDSNEELDLSVDSERSFSTSPSPPQPAHTHVPKLPNRNAVYVVNPVYARMNSEEGPVEVVNFAEDSMETEDKPNTRKIDNYKEEEEEAQDLSVRPRRPSSESNSSTTGSSEYNKSTGNADRGYLTPSPKSALSHGLPPHKGSVLPVTTPLHYDQIRHQQALQMAAMSHALNMHYTGIPSSMYPPSMHHSPHSSTPPSYSSLKDPNHNISPSAPSVDSLGSTPSPLGLSSSGDDRKKRSRVFIDPLTEIPKLEKWFIEDTHPSSYMIEKYTEELNRSTYRQRFPRLEPKNVQLWFKNHRAKVKRTRLEQQALSQATSSSPASASMYSVPSQVAMS